VRADERGVRKPACRRRAGRHGPRNVRRRPGGRARASEADTRDGTGSLLLGLAVRLPDPRRAGWERPRFGVPPNPAGPGYPRKVRVGAVVMGGTVERGMR